MLYRISKSSNRVSLSDLWFDEKSLSCSNDLNKKILAPLFHNNIIFEALTNFENWKKKEISSLLWTRKEELKLLLWFKRKREKPLNSHLVKRFFCSKQNCREHCSVAVLLNWAHRTILTLKLAAITFHI